MVDLPPLSESIVVAAAPDRVWAAVADLKAMRRRSPELVGTLMPGGPKPGRWGVNLNRRKSFVWPTLSRITRFDAPAAGRAGVFAFTVWPTDVEWSYRVEADGAGTRLTEARTAVVDPSWLVRLAARLGLGGQEGHDVELAEGIRTTLRAIEQDVSDRPA